MWILFFAFHCQIKAQITFEKSIGGNYQDFGFASCSTSDGGCIVCGRTYSFGISGGAIAIRLDSSGSEVWSKTYETSDDDYFLNVCQIGDNGFIGYGRVENTLADDNIYLMRCDSNGDTLWTKVLGNLGDEQIEKLVAGTNGTLYVLGKNSFNNEEHFITKLNVNGNVLWEKKLNIPDYSFHEMVITADDNIVIGGETGAISSIVLVKISEQGDLLWTKNYNYPLYDLSLYSIAATPEGGCVLTGPFSQSAHLAFIRIDQDGDTLWTRQYDGPASDLLYSIIQTSNGNFMGTGIHETDSTSEVLMISIDQSGDTVCTNVLGRSGFYTEGRSVIESEGGGLYVTGIEFDQQNFMYKIYLAKTDSLGRTLCQNKVPQLNDLGSLALQVGSFQPTISVTALSTNYISTFVNTGGSANTICSSIGINELNNSVPIDIFPNPSNGVFHISFSENNPYEKLIIFNALGENIINLEMKNQETLDIDLSDRLPGIYLIRFQSGNQYQTARICLVD
jgi:hypothetical protein